MSAQGGIPEKNALTTEEKTRNHELSEVGLTDNKERGGDELDSAEDFVHFQPAPGLHSPYCQNEATLLGAPPEIRNMIYTYLIRLDKCTNSIGELKRRRDNYTYPERSVDIRYTPAILRTCTQIRQECLPKFLSANEFVAFLHEDNQSHSPLTDDGYGYLLDIFDSIGHAQASCIKSLALICGDRAELNDGPGTCTDDSEANYGLISLWYEFLPELLSRGLLASQLRWFGILLPKNLTLQGFQNPCLVLEAKRLATIYKAIITPTLWIYECQTKNQPVPDIWAQIDPHRTFFQHSIDFDDEVERVGEIFNSERYRRETRAVGKEHWRKQALSYQEAKDVRPLYRKKYPTWSDYLGEQVVF